MIQKNISLTISLFLFLSNIFHLEIKSQSGNDYEDLLLFLVNEEYKDCYNKSIK